MCLKCEGKLKIENYFVLHSHKLGRHSFLVWPFLLLHPDYSFNFFKKMVALEGSEPVKLQMGERLVD